MPYCQDGPSSLLIRNHRAYEIATYWGEEPPPREILEDVSAKGGFLRTRTLENYSASNARDGGNDSTIIDAADTTDQLDDPSTPKREKLGSEKPETEKNDSEEPGSASRYSTRMCWVHWQSFHH